MKEIKIFTLLVGIAASAAAFAAATPAHSVSAFKNARVLVESQFTMCSAEARTDIAKLAYVGASGGRPALTSDKCIADGKELVKRSFDEIKSGYGKSKLPKDLAEWRLEWTAAFDDAKLQSTDTEASYLRRTEDAKQKAQRASTKLEIAME